MPLSKFQKHLATFKKNMKKEDFKSEYPWLFRLNIFFRALGVINIIVSIVSFIIWIAEVSFEEYVFYKGDSYIFFLSFAGSLTMIIFSFALAELIKLIVRIEFNTRKDNIDHQDQKTNQSSPGVFK